MYQKDLQKSACHKIDVKRINNVLDSLSLLNKNSNISVRRVKITDLQGWLSCKNTGNIRHISGKFFEIKGIKYPYANNRIKKTPIIIQNEIGILGILCKKIRGKLRFLLKAKFEPGNINNFQLSPTIQATKSNINKVHGGKGQEFIQYFRNYKKKNLILNSLQSEQGDRFYKKRNRNIVIFTREKINIKNKKEFFWLTLSEIKALMQFDNIVNMDARSVISCLNYGNFKINKNIFFNSIISSTPSLYSKNKIMKTIKAKQKFKDKTKLVNLNQISGYKSNKSSASKSNNFFILGVKVKSSSREVNSWDQPMIKNINKENYVLLIKNINNQFHMSLSFCKEPGIYNNCEFGPTFSFTSNKKSKIKNIYNELISKNSNKIIHQSSQSEEGGRFYSCSNNYIIIHSQSTDDDLLKNNIWVGLNQFSFLVAKQCIINVQLRTLYSLLKFN